MSLPVPFSDISKSTNDLLGRDFYHLAAANLEIKTTAPNGVTFAVKGKQGHKDGAISGNIETKYSDKGTGLSLTQGWTTANILDTKVEVAELLAPGLKADLATSFIPASGASNAKVSFYFNQSAFAGRAFIDLFKASFVGDVAFAHDGFLAGGELGYDVSSGKITKYSGAVGYTHPVYSTSVTATNNLSVYSAGYYHKINAATEAGAKATWDSKAAAAAQGVALEVAAKHKLDATTFAKAKINNQGIAALSYSQDLRQGVKLGLGLSIDTQRLNESAHKLGFSLAFEA
ncbi:hypothetical protein NADFUDRAFT_39692 [Nadsonia fulvescens var. elongata DSM 6958]|uniref:Mitochondrial porin n=1 Tax=Nadsonia fulvescens var. elongata DSM 6958 TaxID=857566 RepID=A0A1E3PSR7_9ASCO|nr:hypothetical protein NADFUDRAFT_39692 [Nadsonia fulvescens var. elongata DSM 6958]